MLEEHGSAPWPTTGTNKHGGAHEAIRCQKFGKLAPLRKEGLLTLKGDGSGEPGLGFIRGASSVGADFLKEGACPAFRFILEPLLSRRVTLPSGL